MNDWTLAIGIFGAAATATNLLNAWITNGVRVEITQLKLEMSEARGKDREWLDDKFVPRVELEQRFRLVEAKLGIHVN